MKSDGGSKLCVETTKFFYKWCSVVTSHFDPGLPWSILVGHCLGYVLCVDTPLQLECREQRDGQRSSTPMILSMISGVVQQRAGDPGQDHWLSQPAWLASQIIYKQIISADIAATVNTSFSQGPCPLTGDRATGHPITAVARPGWLIDYAVLWLWDKPAQSLLVSRSDRTERAVLILLLLCDLGHGNRSDFLCKPRRRYSYNRYFITSHYEPSHVLICISTKE